MSFFKKAQAKLDSLTEKRRSWGSNSPPSPQTPFSSRPNVDRPDIMTLRDRYIVRNRQTSQLEVEGTGEVVRFASLCAPDLFDDEGFEKEDSLRTIRGFGRWPVTRTYTLKVKSKHIGKGHINGWNQQAADFDYAEDMFVSIDHVLAVARNEGVRVIIPIINQDFGGDDTNWVGNYVDLIRMRRGIQSYQDAKKVDWWTDPECFDSMIKIVNKLLTRTNTFNGIKYCEDSTILAWETGNEMNNGGLRPAPGSWTVGIAEHIKQHAPKTLVMDGSFARTEDISKSYAPEVLSSDAVDIISWHYYGFGEKKRIKSDVDVARKHGKVFIAGEYGFFKEASEFVKFLSHMDSCGVSGSLAWSLRPHAIIGGFKTHGEGNNIFSYHAPGWEPQAPEFDHREHDVVNAIRNAAFTVNGERPPKQWPVPSAPQIIFHPDAGAGPQGAFFWRGGSWAHTYEVWINDQGGGEDGWECCMSGLTDNVQPGKLRHHCADLLQHKGCSRAHIMMRGVSLDGEPGPFSNIVVIG